MGGYTFWCLVVLLTACKDAGSSPSPGEYSGRDYSSYSPCQNIQCRNGGYCESKSTAVAYCVCQAGYSGSSCQHKSGLTLSIENIRCNTTCATATSCRICQQCDSCGLEPLCLTYDALLNDLDTECHAHGYVEAILVKTSKSPIGYTKMTCGSQGMTYQCPSGSDCLTDGRGGGVCCRSSVGIDYIRNKPGSCPPSVNTQYCGTHSCRGDIDCAGNLKCCKQCGNKCTNPYTDPCQNTRCSNGGLCTVRGLQVVCECPQGFSGQYCDISQLTYNACLNSRCINGGRCHANGLVTSCECPQGFIGQYCEVRQDNCLNSKCFNGGQCEPNGLISSCKCLQGFSGQYCEIRQDLCSNSRCVNGGRCLANGLVSSCQCPQGYIGQYCESRQDPCSNSRCVNGGRCLANGLVSSCQCPQGYIGQYCESRQDPCYNYRCENGAQCLAIGDRQFCQCQQGYTGYRCEARIDTRDYTYGSCNSTCSTKSSCRVCLTCDTCRAESLCLDNTKLVKDLDRECQACGYVEALLVSSIQSPVGYSPLKCKSSLTCPSGSACVEDGRGSGTCCRNKVGLNYLDNKPGSCPTQTGLTCGGIGCQRDSDCAGNLKCCRSCGNQCVSPVLPLADVCSSCPRGTICATVDKCLPGSGACQEQARPRCVTDSCGGCSSGEKCKVVFDDRLCRNYGDCDSYVYKCVPVQTNTCTSSCGVGTACAAVGKCCVVQAGNDKQCDSLYRCQNVRQCSQCRDGLYCRDIAVNCVGSQCPQSYECIDPCGGCSAGTVCRLNGLQGVNRYECVSQQPCGGCSSGLVCKDVQTVCDGNYCVKQQCVAPKNDQCGGCPNGLSCKYISTGCPTTQCSPPTYRCVSETLTEGQCPYVPQSYSLQNIYCKSLTSGLKCNSDNDCQSDNDKCCPDSCGARVCKRCYWKRK